MTAPRPPRFCSINFPEATFPPGCGRSPNIPRKWGCATRAIRVGRLWALAKAGRADVVVKDLRERWAPLPSVQLNNTLQEFWHLRPDSTDGDWSHSCPVPLYVSYMSLAGIRPIEPGFARCEIRPQLADLDFLELTAFTVKGPLGIPCRRETRGIEKSPSRCRKVALANWSCRALKARPSSPCLGPNQVAFGAINCANRPP